MSIKAIYLELKRRKRVKTIDQFSSKWLRRSPAYFGVMGERAGTDALMCLWHRLQAAGEIDLAMAVFALVLERVGQRSPVAAE